MCKTTKLLQLQLNYFIATCLLDLFRNVMKGYLMFTDRSQKVCGGDLSGILHRCFPGEIFQTRMDGDSHQPCIQRVIV